MLTSSQQIKLGAILSYIAMGINILAGLLYTPWMIKCIGQSDYGLYTLALSIINLFLFDFGLSTAITRFIAKNNAEHKENENIPLVSSVLKLYLIIDCIIFLCFIIIYLFIPQLYKELTAPEIDKLKVVFCIAAISSLVLFPAMQINGILNAYEKFVEVKICDLLQRVIVTLVLVGALLCGGGLFTLVIINSLGGIIFTGLKLFFLYRSTPIRFNLKAKTSKKDIAEVGSFSLWMTIVTLCQRCIFNITPSILGYFSGSTAIAIFGIATTLEGYTFTFANALNGMFLPRVSVYAAENDTKSIQYLMSKVGRIQLLITGIIIYGFAFLGKEFITLWLGEDFNLSYICTLLVIIPSLFHLPQEIGANYIMANNKVKYLAIIYLIMAILNVILMALLVPFWGAPGAALSICISYFIRTIGQDIIYQKLLHLDILNFFKKTFFPYFLPSLLMFIIGYVISFIILKDVKWVNLIIKILLFAITYCIIYFFLYMQKDERHLILSPLIKFVQRSK